MGLQPKMEPQTLNPGSNLNSGQTSELFEPGFENLGSTCSEGTLELSTESTSKARGAMAGRVLRVKNLMGATNPNAESCHLKHKNNAM